jgi:hypothetical protein
LSLARENGFNTYIDMMANNGVIGFNDVEENHPGSLRFWNELKNEYETELFGEGDGVSGLVYL